MIKDTAAIIAERAVSQIGTPFKLHGRVAFKGLDCVGLVAHAIEPFDSCAAVPNNYTMRGDFTDRISAYLECAGLQAVANGVSHLAGDILLTNAGARQQHLLIMTGRGLVHAHAGLRRVVLAGAASAWPITGCWRFTHSLGE